MSDELDIACHINVVTDGIGAENFEASLDALAALGYRSVVLHPLDPVSTDSAALRRAFAASGLSPITIAGQSPEADVSSADPSIGAAGEAELLRQLELLLEIGGDQLNGVPYGVFGHPMAPVGADALARAAEAVGRVADRAHELGVTMTFEVVNRYEIAAINTAAQAIEFVRRSGSEHLRIHLDSFHMGVEEADSFAAVESAVGSLGYLELGQSGRGPIGTGSVDNAGVVRTALAAGYRGRIGVEAFSRGIIPTFVADLLAIWREPYPDGLRLAADAIALIRGAASTV